MYTIGQLAKLSGVTTKTLRYYDQIGLLKPSQLSDKAYRLYGPDQVNLLQQILYYRQFEFSLSQIKEIIYNPDFDIEETLESQISFLQHKMDTYQAQIDALRLTLEEEKGLKDKMTNEKFEAFKDQALKENEDKYGQEIREKYGEDQVQAFNQKFKGMTQETYQKMEALNQEIASLIKVGLSQTESNPDQMKALAQAHKDWLGIFAPQGYDLDTYQANLVDMYMADSRFQAYYDKIGPGATEYLYKAVKYSQTHQA